MIKINLLPQKRPKRQAAPGTDSAAKEMAIGVGALVGVSALVFVLLDLPRRSELSDLTQANESLAAEIATKTTQLTDLPRLQSEEANAIAKIQSINRLLEAKVVPANVLHELGQIMTSTGPTMTASMAKLTETDTNKQFQADWDPTHVWLSGFTDAAGVFKLEGGAQSKEDVTQLSKRLAASVYFIDVVPSGGERVTDLDSGLSYFKFTITGKVAY